MMNQENMNDVGKRKVEEESSESRKRVKAELGEIVNEYIQLLKMEKIPETPLYSKIVETGERVVFVEAGFLKIITSKGNKREPVDFKKINMNEFNRAMNEASVIMMPVSYLYRHWKNPSLASKLKNHEDHIGLVIYRKEQKRFVYVDTRVNSETLKVSKDVRVKKVYNIAMPFIRKKFNLEGKYKTQKLKSPNPMPAHPYIPILWIVEQILANPNGPIQDPSQLENLEEYKEKVEQALKGEDNDSDSNEDNSHENILVLN